jgi:hypothetical protein
MSQEQVQAVEPVVEQVAAEEDDFLAEFSAPAVCSMEEGCESCQ